MSSQNSTNENFLDVVGIGNAIVDILVNSSETFLEKHSLAKGGMTIINEEDAEKLFKENLPNLETSGGSAANTIAGIAQLGGKAGFIGRVKKDSLGETFTKDIRSSGATFNLPAINEGPPTARCFIYVTPDAQRTMCTYLGASIYLGPEDLDLSLIRKAKVLYLEGYLWDNQNAKNAFITAAEECKKAGGKIALSLSDFLCIERHRDSFLYLVENYIDILFANETEIKALYKAPDMEIAKNAVKGKCELAVLTRGEKGSLIVTKNDEYTIKSYNFGEVIDTTGAGDLYASGFLYGYTSGKDLVSCGNIGSICSGHIVSILGPRAKTSLSLLIKKEMQN